PRGRRRDAARAKSAAHHLLHHRLRARQPPPGPPRLGRARRGADGPALGAARLAGGRDPPHGAAARSLPRSRDPPRGGPAAAAATGPTRPGPVFPAPFCPSLGAFYAATTGISAALYAREITGRGQRVETSLLQGALACASGVWQRAEKTDAPMFDSWILASR